MTPNNRRPNRFVCVESTYFQSTDEQPAGSEVRFARTLTSDEQPYQRRITVGPEWADLDTGWLNGVGIGMLVLRNTEGEFTVQPTPEERDAALAKILQVAVASKKDDASPVILQFADVRPGESARFEPSLGPNRRILVRCAAGSARVVVTAIPS